MSQDITEVTGSIVVEDLGPFKLPITVPNFDLLTNIDVVFWPDGHVPESAVALLGVWAVSVTAMLRLGRGRVDGDGRVSFAQIRPGSSIGFGQLLPGHGPRRIVATNAPGLIAYPEHGSPANTLRLEPRRAFHIGPGTMLRLDLPNPGAVQRIILVG